jgi:hypothetical protein
MITLQVIYLTEKESIIGGIKNLARHPLLQEFSALHTRLGIPQISISVPPDNTENELLDIPEGLIIFL